MEQYTSPQADSEYAQAFASVRAAKNWLWWLIVLSLAVQATGFVMVRYVKVLEPTVEAVDAQEKAPASKPADAAAKDDKVEAAATMDVAGGSIEVWRSLLAWALPISRFLIFSAGMLLVLTLLLGVKLSLVGQTGGIAGYMSAFFWSLLLLVLLVPWQQVLTSEITRGVAFNLAELTTQTRKSTAAGAGAFAKIFYYVRFIAYPLVVLALMLIVRRKFSCGYKRMLGVEPAETNADVTNDTPYENDKI